jgi:hypothetical protein
VGGMQPDRLRASLLLHRPFTSRPQLAEAELFQKRGQTKEDARNLKIAGFARVFARHLRPSQTVI